MSKSNTFDDEYGLNPESSDDYIGSDDNELNRDGILSKIDYDISKKDIKLTKKRYLNEFSELIKRRDGTYDKSTLRVLTYGIKNNISLFINIFDCVSRKIVNNYINGTPSHFNNTKLDYIENLRNKKVKKDLSTAIATFNKRLFWHISLCNEATATIHDNIEHFIQYTTYGIKLVKNIVKVGSHNHVQTPIQFDIWIKPKYVTGWDPNIFNDYDTDTNSDSEGNNNKSSNNSDCNINIKKRLISNNLTYIEEEYNDHFSFNQFGMIFRELKAKLKKTDHQRYCCIVDRYSNNNITEIEIRKDFNSKQIIIAYIFHIKSRYNITIPSIYIDILTKYYKYNVSDHKRLNNTTNSIYMYQPPNDSRNINPNTPEIYFKHSRKCVLPKIPNKIYSQNISSQTGLNGYMFMISIHAHNENDIKVYLYFNGDIMRFYPNDMINIWPKWFDKTINNNHIKRYSYNINIPDNNFKQFYHEMTHNKH